VIKGIDVSSHQHRVDWTRVTADGVSFAYIKATEGVGFVDPKFGAFVAGAQAAGIRHGFYHFARPDTRSGAAAQTAVKDAQSEADAFLAVAFPKQGQLLPVLDLETGGLPPRLLVRWAKAWLERVAARAKVRPILYTYPAFWSQMGNTTQFGSYPLWIASYGVPAPRLPAGWKSYTIWQYSSSGSVPGISGPVDLDRLTEGMTLAKITIRPAPPEPVQNFPGPVPKPDWFWTWLRWRLGAGEFEGLMQNRDVRPDEAPHQIPDWAWQSLEKLTSKRSPQPPGG
jgi:lysozyme